MCRSGGLRAAATVVSVAGAAVGLWLIDPAATPWLPSCPFHLLTGLYCPGCGSMRALHYLVHGDLGAAWRMNSLFVVLAPYLCYVVGVEAYSALADRRVRLLHFPSRGVWALLVVSVMFGVARNVPIYPLTLLAPR